MSDEAAVSSGLGEVVGRLKAQLKAWVKRAKAAEERVKAVETERDTATSAAESARTKYDESKLKGEVDRLKGELRTRTHRQAFDRLAKERGAADDTLDLLWQTSGYQATKDDVDEAALGALLDAQKARPGIARLFGEGAPEAKPGPANGQGQRDKTGGRFQATRADLRDPAWCAANDGKRREAMKAGTFDIID